MRRDGDFNSRWPSDECMCIVFGQNRSDLIDMTEIPKKKHGYGEDEHREIMEKQMAALRRLKADFGLEGVTHASADHKEVSGIEVRTTEAVRDACIRQYTGTCIELDAQKSDLIRSR